MQTLPMCATGGSHSNAWTCLPVSRTQRHAPPCAKGRGPGRGWQKITRHGSHATPPRSFNLAPSSNSRCSRKTRKRATSRTRASTLHSAGTPNPGQRCFASPKTTTGTITRLDQGEKPGCAGCDQAEKEVRAAVPVLAYSVLSGETDEAARVHRETWRRSGGVADDTATHPGCLTAIHLRIRWKAVTT